MLSLAIAPVACGSPDPSGETDPTAAETDPTVADPTETDPTETDPTEAETDTETDPTEAETDTETEPSAECFERDPAVDAAVVLEVADLDVSGIYDLSFLCRVDAVTETGSRLRTEMTCDDGGGERATVLEIAAPFSGPPLWGEGDEVSLRAQRLENEELPDEHVQAIRLSTEPADQLLVLAYDGGSSDATVLPDPWWYGPISLDIDTSLCGDATDGDEVPQQLLTGEVGDCCSGAVRGGQRGLIDLSGAYSGFDVDAARVEVGSVNHLEVVIRAVDVGI